MAVKTPVKKSTITLDELRKSQNEAWKAIREGRKDLVEYSERQEKANLEFKESQEKANQEFKESQEKANQELRDALKESKKALDKSMGELTNKLGSIVENIMVPDLPKKFKALGYSIDKIATYKYTKQGVYAQIDALLENGTLAIAVEVKTTLRKEDIDDHILRMEKVRQHADKNGDTRQFLGAMAATIADKTLITYALKQGLFIIQPSGENIKVTKPPKERVW